MSEGTPVLRMPIRGTFFGCCASAGVESANMISTTRNRSGIGPSDWKVRGFKHCYSETPALVSSSKELLRRGASPCVNYLPMDDRWRTWTFICQSCRETFELTLQPRERIIEYARKKPCPHCRLKPMTIEGFELWHQIIGVRYDKTLSEALVHISREEIEDHVQPHPILCRATFKL